MSLENDILLLIETLIKKGNQNILSFKENLISELKKKISINDLKTLIKKKRSEKNIYFIRHAQAMHNVLEIKYKGDFSKCNVYDPELTKTGIEQTRKTIGKLLEADIDFDSVFVSPLSRTIQTYNLIKDYLDKNTKVYVTDFAKEVLSYCDKNKGKKLSSLKEELQNSDLSLEYMTKEFWWFDLGEQKDGEYENDLLFGSRLRIFMLWLFFRPEKNILIISHSHVFAELQDYGIYNADLAKMDNHILSKKIQELFN
jgi:broad specificity phosphatase PhoE